MSTTRSLPAILQGAPSIRSVKDERGETAVAAAQGSSYGGGKGGGHPCAKGGGRRQSRNESPLVLRLLFTYQLSSSHVEEKGNYVEKS